MDVFDYSAHFLHRVVSVHEPSRPVQIEIHPGLNCDLYRCPHCYGHQQKLLPGPLITAAEIGNALDDVAAWQPTIIVSGINTEPLTHPDAAGIIRAVRRRRLPLGLYTKARRLDDAVVQAIIDGEGECFVTISIDAASRDEYLARHDIPKGKSDSKPGARGENYYDIMFDNLRRLKSARDAARSCVQIRAAFLLFAESVDDASLDCIVSTYEPLVDLIRFAIPQYRNDGAAPGTLPEDRRECLERIARRFAGHQKVKVLVDTAEPRRDRVFNRCWAQRFQAVIDKSGNVFPCPQVAVGLYAPLSYGNIRANRLADILTASRRLQMFDLDVDRDMRCRICDRKDEAVNIALDRLAHGFAPRDGVTSSRRIE